MDLILDYLTNGNALATLLSIIFLYSLFLYNRSSKDSKNKEAPIVTGAWPILGHLPLLKGSKTPHRTLGDLADKYGPLFAIKLGSKNALVLSNWEMAKECFTKFDSAISTRPKLVATEHLAYNGAMLVLAPYGPYWREVRKIAMSEILANRRIEKLQEVCVLEVQTSIKELFNVWKSNINESEYVLVELKQWFIELNFNIVLPMLVGKRYFSSMNVLNEEEAQRCIKAVKEILRLMGEFTVGDA
ncbi:cytochrome P450, partial [Trifolium medium]|nr:cytochrome P450 [Trifolium medium]